MKEPLKVGDRVAVYGRDWQGTKGFRRFTGLVTRVHLDGSLQVETEKFSWTCDPKQCRRLVKKPRREVWVAPSTNESEAPIIFHKPPQTKKEAGVLYVRDYSLRDAWASIKELVHYVEVRKKRGKK